MSNVDNLSPPCIQMTQIDLVFCFGHHVVKLIPIRCVKNRYLFTSTLEIFTSGKFGKYKPELVSLRSIFLILLPTMATCRCNFLRIIYAAATADSVISRPLELNSNTRWCWNWFKIWTGNEQDARCEIFDDIVEGFVELGTHVWIRCRRFPLFVRIPRLHCPDNVIDLQRH